MSKTKVQEKTEQEQPSTEEMPQAPVCSIDAEAIRSSCLAVEMSPKQVAKLIKSVSPRCLQAGELLLEEGHEEDTLYVVTEG